MRALVLSDLHFEFHADSGRDLMKSIAAHSAGIDVCILAGDIVGFGGLTYIFEWFARLFPDVVYVQGNHEFYGCSRHKVNKRVKQLCDKFPNLHWLDNKAVKIHGQKIVGAPLWFMEDPLASSWDFSDFIHIPDFRSWVYEQNKKACRFLASTIRSEDVVITHHLPTFKSVAPQYRDACNAFFVCDIESMMRAASPRLWIHGHTHASLDYQLEETRVVCNPFGYPHELNPDFTFKVIDI